MTVRLKALATTDLDRLTALALAFHEEDGHALRESDRKALNAICEGDPMARGWLIEESGEVIGYTVLTLGFSIEYGGRDGFIDDLYLIPGARGRGIGTQVMALIETEAKLAGVNALHLEVGRENDRAQALYRGQGFAGNDRLLMSKRLKASNDKYDRETLTLRTPRLVMHPAHEADPATVLALLNHADIRRYLMDDEIRSVEWLSDFIDASRENFENRGFGLWTCALPDDMDQIIGVGGFTIFRESGEPELLYALLPDFWGQGLATEMTRAFIDVAFRDLGFASVTASTDIPNEASVSVMRRAGMAHERTDLDSGVAGEVFYRISREDWRT